MARVLAISSQVIYGPVGNTAAVPAMQSQGHDVMQLPTVLLSNHPGHGPPEKLDVAPEKFAAMLDAVMSRGALLHLDAVLTGYFASQQQVHEIANIITTLKQNNPHLVVLVDPVIGDHGKLYVAAEIAAALRDHLLPLATITTPNLFELEWLTASELTSQDAIVKAVRSLGIATTIVTSVPAGKDELQTLHITKGVVRSSVIARRVAVPNGTGDFLAGLYLAHALHLSEEPAFHHAMSQLEHAITLSAGGPVLKIAESLQS
jgi:pyridoxine kinase